MPLKAACLWKIQRRWPEVSYLKLLAENPLSSWALTANHKITGNIWRADATAAPLLKYRWTQALPLAEVGKDNHLVAHWSQILRVWSQFGVRQLLTGLSSLGQLRGRHPQDVTQLLGSLLLRVTGTHSHPQEGASRGHQNKSVVRVELGRHGVELQGYPEIFPVNTLTSSCTLKKHCVVSEFILWCRFVSTPACM